VGISEHPDHFGPAEEMRPQNASPLDVISSSTRGDSTFHCWRGTSIENLDDDAQRTRADARDFRQGSIGSTQRGELLFERQDGRCGSLVAEGLLRRRLNKRQVAKQAANHGVDIHSAHRTCKR
jgi:hypothetical protein